MDVHENTPKREGFNWIAVFTAVGLMAVVVWALASSHTDLAPEYKRVAPAYPVDPQTYSRACDPVDAAVLGDRYIKNILTAPATADFASYNDARVQFKHDTLYYYSYVDSQNGFGAMIRTQFVVVMLCTDGSLSVLDEAHQ